MFELVTVEDAVRIEPEDFRLPLGEAVSAVVQRNFLDKCLPGVGYVLTFYDLQRVEGGTITQGQGSVQYDARFRLVVFRPLDGEVILAKLYRATEEGIWLTLGFFEDIFVPAANLQDKSTWEKDEQNGNIENWVWQPEPTEDNPAPDALWYDCNHVRLRVTKVVWRTPPTAAELKHALQNKLENVPVVGSSEAPFVPMQVVGTVNEVGLGLITWW